MKKILPFLLAGLAMAAPALAQEAAPAVEVVADVVETAPVADTGNVTWVMVSAILVMMMSVPGLALFYGGLARSKNMLSVLMQVFSAFCIVALLWVIFGYSLAFTDGGGLSAFIGDMSKAFLAGIGVDTLEGDIYEYNFIAFQMAFACIATALIVGATAERLKFSAIMLFCVIWFVLSYLPICHMVWQGNGYLAQHGALDFAGGTVIHINAGVAGMIAAYVAGPRLGFRKELMAPHNLTFTFIGGALLWMGWFGFNAGSALAADGVAALAVINTVVATAAAALAWSFGEWAMRGHPSLLGGVSGGIAGLVGITPAAGFVGPMGAIAIGIITGLVCMWFVNTMKSKIGIDDSFDVFGIHGVGGIVGAVLTGVFVFPAFGGQGVEVSMGYQLYVQVLGVVIAMIWSAVVSFAAICVVKALVGLRVPANDERQGLDITTHGENAYN
ncbi:MAG: ammonium transporter [Paracoccus sp. (in: a-proteobacteria)]|uniref:ammonium transporter n=1 Tax=Paracoccus sp. TaxID=267 RepID=UPI0026E04D59|nr:ammonium transporter [Paracoccus sp. (in: a-proteobacteria)]MDO5622165.1 ammonium transporter [Paracoccus sp. (in: a-proteobacteria)]